MVYIPKPKATQRILGEAFGFLVFIFISRVVVATTGGSTAFATNNLWNAAANGAGYAAAIFMFPYAYMDMTILICMVLHDLLMWVIGRQKLSPWDIGMYVVFGFIQFVMGALAYLFIWAFVPSDVSHLGIPLVPSGVSDERAIFSEVIQASFWVFAFFMISEIVGLVFKQARSPAVKDKVTGKISPARYNHTMYLIAAVTRATFLGLVRFGISLGGIPITGGLYNTLGYLSGALVSWTWKSTWYVPALGPIGGMIGFLAYLLVFVIPSIPFYRIAFGNENIIKEELAQLAGPNTNVKGPPPLAVGDSTYHNGSVYPRQHTHSHAHALGNHGVRQEYPNAKMTTEAYAAQRHRNHAHPSHHHLQTQVQNDFVYM